MNRWTLHTGDVLEVLQGYPENHFHAMLTDPPAGINFMNHDWDHHKGGREEWVSWMREVMRECLRVLRPGAHALVWSIPRTSHWMALALEDAGFEVRDVVLHLYGSGFPKGCTLTRNEAAKDWEGYSTLLKPAYEPWYLVRKPLEGTLAQTALHWGTGGLNIEGCRIEHGLDTSTSGAPKGRWPANVTLDETAAAMLDGQSRHEQGDGKTSIGCRPPRKNNVYGKLSEVYTVQTHYNDTGGASRFFYCAKASTAERNAGLEAERHNPHPTIKPLALGRWLATLLLPPRHIPDRRILTPFSGSGSELIAALQAGWDHAVGIEAEAEYNAIALARLEYWLENSLYQSSLMEAAD